MRFPWLPALVLGACATVEGLGDSMLLPLHKGDVDVLARTLYGEARGEGVRGMQAVAWVVVNRARRPGDRFPDTITGVCKQRAQFTCWSQSDPNAKLCAAVDERDLSFLQALYAATSVLSGEVADPVMGADHYFVAAMKNRPAWADEMEYKGKIGAHVFYKERR